MTWSQGCCGCLPSIGGSPLAPGGGVEGVCLEPYHWAQTDGTFSTNLNTPQATGHQLVVPAVVAGTYLLRVVYLIQANVFENFNVNVDLDGGGAPSFVFPQTHDERMEDNDDLWVPFARKLDLGLTAAPHTFELYLWTDTNDLVTLADSAFDLWRTA